MNHWSTALRQLIASDRQTRVTIADCIAGPPDADAATLADRLECIGRLT